jgi:CHAT domain-containing protein/DNA-binding beta-propeller fold protein YncE
LYVSNPGSGTISAIDTANLVVKSSTPRIAAILKDGMAISHDGRRIYAVVAQATLSDRTTLHCALAIVNTADMSISYLALPGERWDELAVTRDDRGIYLTQVREDAQSFPHGAVYLLHTDTAQLKRVIEEPVGCPVGIAIPKDEQRLYVSYQCYGPGGSRGHDSLGVYELPSYHRIAVIQFQDLPNVGGPLALSPDGGQLWVNAGNACIDPNYDHKGCPTYPGFPLYVIRTSDLRLLNSYGFSLEDGNGRISFSPKGEAFIGDGIVLKEIAAENLDNAKDKVTRFPIANPGEVAFDPDGNTAYVTVMDRNAVYVLERTGAAADPDQATTLAKWKKRDVATKQHVCELALPTVVGLLGTNGSYGRCASDGKCVRVEPGEIKKVLLERGDQAVRGCWPRATTPGKDSEVYRCVANLLLSRPAAAGNTQAIESAMQMRALEANEEYLEWKLNFIKEERQLEELDAKTKRTPQDQQQWDKLSSELEGLRKDCRAFNDVTRGLYDPSTLRKSLRDSAAVVAVFSWGGHTYTVLISKDDEMVQEDMYDGKPVGWNALKAEGDRFLGELSAGSSNSHSLEETKAAARRLYDILIGHDDLSKKLAAARRLAPGQKLTLVWLTEGLEYLPTAALYDGQHYLVQLYGSAVLTTPSLPEQTVRNTELRGLVAAATTGSADLSALTGLREQIRKLFSDQEPPEAGKIPAKILLDPDFTADALSGGLKELEKRPDGAKLFLHIGSHFFLSCDEEDSYLLMGDQTKMPLNEFGQQSRFPLGGLDFVAFSACQTAAGKPTRDKSCDARRSLAFFLDERGNGASSVLASLWEVDLESTADLMWDFYEHWVTGKFTKVEALRQAQVDLLMGMILPTDPSEPASFEDPYYWAPFVLMGDWR